MKLIIKNIDKSYEEKNVIKNASFEFEKGKIYALLGRNGAGKTTLFDCINGDTEINSGEILISDNGTTKPIKREYIGYTAAVPMIPGFLTAREFVEFILEVNEKDIKDLKSVDEYFDMVIIKEEDRGKLLKDFSLGMKNKMQMLVNVILKPPIILLDEPLASFDVVVAEEMKNLFKSIKKDHIIIFSTHIMELAMELCDEITILADKKLTSVPKDKELIIKTLKDSE